MHTNWQPNGYAGNPDAVLYLEDGTPALYDWPNDVMDRPDEALAVGSFWPGSGGGGGR